MTRILQISVLIAAFGAFVAPAYADKGGVPNENASDKAHGKGGSGGNAGGNGNGNGNGHDKNADNPGHSKHDH